MSESNPLGTEPADAQVAAHTPGPWRFHRTSLGFAAVVTGIKEVITKVICVYGDDGAPEAHSALSDADARLIAAAPDLLEAAEKTIAENLYLADGTNCTLRHLKAAIAKARGVSQ